MNCSPEELAQKQRFEEFYDKARTPVMRAIERSVCGCDYGGNSWTTRDEAQRIAGHLQLRPGARLLDLGAGCGWPSLYFAKISGCDVTLTDLPFTGLQIAAERADAESLPGACWLAVADAAELPFRHGSFDAVNHSDLLCCLKQKRAVLEACRRAIKGDGRMGFTVISVAPGLSQEDYRRAVDNGPEFIESDTDYQTLLRQTGWRVLHYQDITLDYAATCRRQLDADEAHKDGLEDLIGANEFVERVAGWQQKLIALGDKLLRRELFVATPEAP